MILDATAGNRTMWKLKDSENIIYIDIQTQLEVKPTIFCSNEQTPFRNGMFDTIFYDPPHSWGGKGHYHTYPYRSEEYLEKWKDKAIPRYYGWERYQSKILLYRHILDAQKEFQRILKDDGILWVKWNEMRIKLYKVLSLFNEWMLLLRLYVNSPSQTAGQHQTFWLALQKTKQDYEQSRL